MLFTCIVYRMMTILNLKKIVFFLYYAVKKINYFNYK